MKKIEVLSIFIFSLKIIFMMYRQTKRSTQVFAYFRAKNGDRTFNPNDLPGNVPLVTIYLVLFSMVVLLVYLSMSIEGIYYHFPKSIREQIFYHLKTEHKIKLMEFD